MPRNDLRKECPNCGLTVPLDAKACEFCEWNFEEEDEWMSEIEKLEQELITEKAKFDDTGVDMMIQSTLRKPEGGKSRDTAPAGAPPPVMKKKVLAQPPRTASNPVSFVKEELGREEEKVKKEPILSPQPRPPAEKPKVFKIDVSKMPAAKEDLDLGPKPSAAVPEKPAPKAAPEEKPKGEKVVRRVIAYGPQKPKTAEAQQPKTASTAAKPAAEAKPKQAEAKKPKPAQAKPAAPAPAAHHETPSREHEKEEKKPRFPGFGRMFPLSMPSHHDKKEEKGVSHPPSKIPPPDSKPKTIKVFVCPICSKEVKETEKRCPNCGAEFE